MSIKVWAKNIETGRIMHINDVDKSFKGKMVCLDENCGEVLTICKGEKKKPYFSHSKNCSCNGGGVETLLSLLSKQILKRCTTFILPEESTIFRGTKILFRGKAEIHVENVTVGEILENGFKSGIKLTDYYGESYYVEASVRSIGVSRRAVYNRYGAKVIDIDLRRFAGSEDIDEKELAEYICGSQGIKTYACSPNIARVEELIKQSEFTSSGDKIACPAYEYSSIVDKKSCKDCPFYMYRKDGAITCAGKGYYSVPVDFRIDDIDMRRDKYSEVLPKPIGIVRTDLQNPIGVCSRCNHDLEIGISKKNMHIQGLYVVDWSSSAYAYRVCPSCKRASPILCPKCGGKMRIYRNNRNGKVFLSCRGSEEKPCECTITLFNGEPCGTNYADELRAVGSLDNFINKHKKSMQILSELRGRYRR